MWHLLTDIVGYLCAGCGGISVGHTKFCARGNNISSGGAFLESPLIAADSNWLLSQEGVVFTILVVGGCGQHWSPFSWVRDCRHSTLTLNASAAVQFPVGLTQISGFSKTMLHSKSSPESGWFINCLFLHALLCELKSSCSFGSNFSLLTKNVTLQISTSAKPAPTSGSHLTCSSMRILF